MRERKGNPNHPKSPDDLMIRLLLDEGIYEARRRKDWEVVCTWKIEQADIVQRFLKTLEYERYLWTEDDSEHTDHITGFYSRRSK